MIRAAGKPKWAAEVLIIDVLCVKINFPLMNGRKDSCINFNLPCRTTNLLLGCRNYLTPTIIRVLFLNLHLHLHKYMDEPAETRIFLHKYMDEPAETRIFLHI